MFKVHTPAARLHRHDSLHVAVQIRQHPCDTATVARCQLVCEQAPDAVASGISAGSASAGSTSAGGISAGNGSASAGGASAGSASAGSASAGSAPLRPRLPSKPQQRSQLKCAGVFSPVPVSRWYGSRSPIRLFAPSAPASGDVAAWQRLVVVKALPLGATSVCAAWPSRKFSTLQIPRCESLWRTNPAALRPLPILPASPAVWLLKREGMAAATPAHTGRQGSLCPCSHGEAGQPLPLLTRGGRAASTPPHTGRPGSLISWLAGLRCEWNG
eukprot:351593-Chlamydomonas_euryale.AAC.2